MSEVATFIAPIYRVRINESLGRGMDLDGKLYLINDRFFIDRLITSKLQKAIGILESDAIRDCSLVAYGKFQANDKPVTLIQCQLLKLQQFSLDLWVIRDNAAAIERGFVEMGRGTASCPWYHLCSLADGTTSPIEFSREELELAANLYRRRVGDTADLSQEHLAKAFDREVVARSEPPLFRALFFLAAARVSHHCSVKIANYCSALESLLLSDSNELTYRLCQRVAWLLGSTSDERVTWFKSLNEAYRIRSQTVHGSSSRKQLAEIAAASKSCDDVLRGILGRILQDEYLRPYVAGKTNRTEDFEKRLLEITLGKTDPCGKGQNSR